VCGTELKLRRGEPRQCHDGRRRIGRTCFGEAAARPRSTAGSTPHYSRCVVDPQTGVPGRRTRGATRLPARQARRNLHLPHWHALAFPGSWRLPVGIRTCAPQSLRADLFQHTSTRAVQSRSPVEGRSPHGGRVLIAACRRRRPPVLPTCKCATHFSGFNEWPLITRGKFTEVLAGSWARGRRMLLTPSHFGRELHAALTRLVK
jgi:hypothetical protein